MGEGTRCSLPRSLIPLTPPSSYSNPFFPSIEALCLYLPSTRYVVADRLLEILLVSRSSVYSDHTDRHLHR
jgi:hypothetical protein